MISLITKNRYLCFCNHLDYRITCIVSEYLQSSQTLKDLSFFLSESSSLLVDLSLLATINAVELRPLKRSPTSTESVLNNSEQLIFSTSKPVRCCKNSTLKFRY